MSKLTRNLRVNGQSEAADRLDEAEKLRAGLRPHRSYIDSLLDDARADDERERQRQEADRIERQYQHIMSHGGKALRGKQAALWDAQGKPTPAVHARALSTRADRPYFAYGMNTNVREMRGRCPNAKPIGGYVLEGFKLMFRTFADIEQAKGARVQGVLWWISEKCEAALDRLEGYPRSYRKGYFDAAKVKGVNGRKLRVMYYYMPKGRRAVAPPSEHYLRCIMEGYDAFHMPHAELIKAAQAAYDANPPMRSFSEPGAGELDAGEQPEFF
jgi:hypothetical protein